MRYLIIFIFSICTFLVQSQVSTHTIVHGGQVREYKLFTPSGYNIGDSLPLVINMHGWTRTHDEQMNKTKFNDIADTANFFVVYPQGTIDSLIGISGTHWNVMFGTGIDDVGFISAMIDEIYWSHGINLSRVYATGFSNGGFMSYTLACELSDRIAAIAPVSGAMNFVQQAVCNPGYVAPCLHIHGTSDNTVPFTGTNIYLGIIFLTEYWGSLNSCDILPNISIVSNSSLFDLCTATINTYDNCNDSAEHLLYIVQNGGHQWPGSSNNNILSGPTCQDFDASEVIWEFFSKYQHPNPRPIVTTNINSDFKVNDLGIFVKGKTINFRSKAQSVEVYNSLGTLLYRNDNLNQQFLELDISNQIIFVRYSNTNGNSTDKVFFE